MRNWLNHTVRGSASQAPVHCWKRRFCLWAMLMLATLAAQAADLIVVRTLTTASGVSSTFVTYDVAFKNGGPGSANGATFSEQLPPGFVVTGSVVCTGAFGGATCPVTVVTNNNPNNSPVPLISGTIGSFPQFSSVRLRITMKLAPQEGSFELTGSISSAGESNPASNTAISTIYVRSLVLDLRTSYSSTFPDIGGNFGNGGATGNVPLSGDTLGTQLPASVTYRLENNGPDLATPTAFSWRTGSAYSRNDFLAYASVEWMRTSYGQPVGTGNTNPSDNDVRITPMTCVATATAVCAAPTLYFIEIKDVGFGWLDRLPTVTPVATPGAVFFKLELSSADIADALAHPNPLYGQSLPAGAALQLTASLTNASYGSEWSKNSAGDAGEYVLTDSALTATNALARTVCQPNAEKLAVYAKVSYVDEGTGLSYAAVSDADLSNNTAELTGNVTRTCPHADIQSVSVSATSNGDGTVLDGENYDAVFEIHNIGTLPSGPIALTANFQLPTNWNGATAHISCNSSDTPGSPCPSQALLDDMLARGGTQVVMNGTTLAPNAYWTLHLSGVAGTTTCPGNFDTGLLPLRIEAYAIGADDIDPSNNSGLPSSDLVLAPQPCSGATQPYSLQVNKTGPFAADGVTPVGTIGAPIAVGDRAYFKITLTNTSTIGVAIVNAILRDSLPSRISEPSNTFISSQSAADGPFQQAPGQPGNLPLTQDVNGTQTIIASGIVCTPFGGALCPASLTGADTQAGDSYSSFEGIIPLLPATSCPVGVTCITPWDPAARVELLVPYRDEPGAAGCTLAGDTRIRTQNRAQLFTASATSTLSPADGTPAVAVPYETSSASTTSIYRLAEPPCPTNGVVAVSKTLTSPVLPATPNGSNTVYAGAIANGPVTYQVVINNASGNGTGFDVVSFSDEQPRLTCRDGNVSNPSGQPGGDRCGVVVVTSLNCSASGGAVCPSASQRNDAVAAAPGNGGNLLVSWGTPGDFTTLQDGASVTFTVGYTVSGVNQFTGSLDNTGSATAKFGVGSVTAASTATVNLPFAAGISMSKTVDKLQAAAGETVTYTIDVVNGGNGLQAGGAVFTDPLPAGLSAFGTPTCVGIAGPSPNPGIGNCPGVITNDGSGIQATLPPIPANSGMRFTITAVAPVGGIVTSVNNAAQVVAPALGGGTNTLRATTNFAIPSAAEAAAGSGLLGFKSVVNLTRPGSAFAFPGDSLRYTVSYFNNGAADVASFMVTDALPASVAYAGGANLTPSGPVTGAALNPGYNGAGQTALLAPGAVLGAGGVVVFTIPVTVNAATAIGTTVLNQASATGTGITGSVATDNVDNTNPLCSIASVPAPCLPAGVTVAGGSVPQAQTAAVEPVAVPVVGFLAPNISKSGTLPTPTTVVWRVTLANNLPANAGKGPMNYSLSDPVPAGMTPGAIACNVTSGSGQTTAGGCTLVGSNYEVTGALDYAAAVTPDVSAERIEIVIQGTLVAGTNLNNTATVTNISAGGGTRSASANVNAPPPGPGGGGGGSDVIGVPTLGQWGLALLSLLLAGGAALWQSTRDERRGIREWRSPTR